MTATPIQKPCPACGSSLVVRQNRATGQEFLGCESWPRCQHSEPLTAYQEPLRRGAPQLPGMDG